MVRMGRMQTWRHWLYRNANGHCQQNRGNIIRPKTSNNFKSWRSGRSRGSAEGVIAEQAIKTGIVIAESHGPEQSGSGSTSSGIEYDQKPPQEAPLKESEAPQKSVHESDVKVTPALKTNNVITQVQKFTDFAEGRLKKHYDWHVIHEAE